MLSLLILTPGLTVVDVGTFSAAKRLPFENQDAFFSAPPSLCGVFDGVSQCPQSRAFAQALAKSSCDSLRGREGEGEFAEQVQLALGKATEAAQGFKGATTACVVRFELDQEQPRLSGYAIGDSECMVLRSKDGGAMSVAEVSPVKFHENGAPYQLAGKGFITDSSEDGVDFAFDLFAGDIVLCYSDGICDNLEPEEIAEIVGASGREPAQAMAREIVRAARAAGWVDDDCTVVAMRMGTGQPVGGEPVFAETAPWEDGRVVMPELPFKLPFA